MSSIFFQDLLSETDQSVYTGHMATQVKYTREERVRALAVLAACGVMPAKLRVERAFRVAR